MLMKWSHSLGSLILDYLTTSLCSAQEKNKSKLYKHKTIKTISIKKYSAGKLYDKLKDVKFANYSEFDNVNNAFVDFSEKIMQAVDEIAPYREFRVKGQTED